MRCMKWIYIKSLGFTKIFFYFLLLLFLLTALMKGVEFAVPLFVFCVLIAIYNGIGHVYIVGFLRCSFCNGKVGDVFWKTDVSNWRAIKRDILSTGKCPHCGNIVFSDGCV